MSFQPYFYVVERPEFQGEKRHWALGGGLLFFGMVVLFWTVGPIVQYQLFHAPKIGLRSFTSPIPRAAILSAAENSDLASAKEWFPAAAADMVALSEVSDYKLSIPRLGIESAVVTMGSDDLSKSLVHWAGTPAPGQVGKSVIFGHSVLPQFFDPENYMTIFSTIHTLDLGDMIFVEYDGLMYQYQVMDMFEVLPTEVSVLDQDLTDKYLTLITCSPPGTYLRRLVVQTKLVPYAGAER